MHELLKNTLLPPMSLLVAALIGQILWGATTTGRRAVTAILFLSYLLSTPLISDTLLSTLEIYPPLPTDGLMPQGAQAIVVLSAESLMTPEYSAPSPGPMTLERLRYGAFLQRRTGLPVLVTGGTSSGRSFSMGSVMRQSLADDFHVPVAWVEEQAQDTHQNATRSAAILKPEGITRILLVTHAWHMARAKLVFERAGVTVIPAPTAFTRGTPIRKIGIGEYVWDLLPSAKAMQNSYFAFHEMIGLSYYFMAFPASHEDK